MSALLVPQTAVDAIVDEVKRYGLAHVETGGFLLVEAGRLDQVTLVALAGAAGIWRAGELFKVSGAALARLFDWASQEGLLVRAQIHSHRVGAFLSRTDARHGFTVEGFTSAVVPDFASPPSDPGAWGWWRCESGRWRKCAPATLSGDRAGTVWFDEEGVSGA
jgi:hypothetical protein